MNGIGNLTFTGNDLSIVTRQDIINIIQERGCPEFLEETTALHALARTGVSFPHLVLSPSQASGDMELYQDAPTGAAIHA